MAGYPYYPRENTMSMTAKKRHGNLSPILQSVDLILKKHMVL